MPCASSSGRRSTPRPARSGPRCPRSARRAESSRGALSRYAQRVHEPNAAGLSLYSARSQLLASATDIPPLDVPHSLVASGDHIDQLRATLRTLPAVSDLARRQPPIRGGSSTIPLSTRPLCTARPAPSTTLSQPSARVSWCLACAGPSRWRRGRVSLGRRAMLSTPSTVLSRVDRRSRPTARNGGRAAARMARSGRSAGALAERSRDTRRRPGGGCVLVLRPQEASAGGAGPVRGPDWRVEQSAIDLRGLSTLTGAMAETARRSTSCAVSCSDSPSRLRPPISIPTCPSRRSRWAQPSRGWGGSRGRSLPMSRLPEISGRTCAVSTRPRPPMRRRPSGTRRSPRRGGPRQLPRQAGRHATPSPSGPAMKESHRPGNARVRRGTWRRPNRSRSAAGSTCSGTWNLCGVMG